MGRKKKSERKRKGPDQIKPIMAGFFRKHSTETFKERKARELAQKFTAKLVERTK